MNMSFEGLRLNIDIGTEDEPQPTPVAYLTDLENLKKDILSTVDRPRPVFVVYDTFRDEPFIDGSIQIIKKGTNNEPEIAFKENGRWERVSLAKVIETKISMDTSNFVTKEEMEALYSHTSSDKHISNEERHRWNSYASFSGVSLNGAKSSREITINADTIMIDKQTLRETLDNLRAAAFTKDDVVKFITKVAPTEEQQDTGEKRDKKILYERLFIGNIEADANEEVTTELMDGVKHAWDFDGWVSSGKTDVIIGQYSPDFYATIEVSENKLILVSKSSKKRTNRTGKYEVIIRYTV
jgi:hypothetical protein